MTRPPRSSDASNGTWDKRILGEETAARYRRFAEREATPTSPMYAALADAVAEHGGLLTRLVGLPAPKRQPNLLFAAVRYLGGPVADVRAFTQFVEERWDAVAATMQRRRTQTNEAARTAIILPALAVFGTQPIALLEVGASAGLCLYPDRWRFDFGHGGQTGPPDAPTIRCESVRSPISTALPLPAAPIQIAFRAGIDLDPLDVANEDDLRWLECLIWPEHTERFERLHVAAEIARREPPRLVRGDLVASLERVAHDAPRDATLVVFHSATMAYLSEDERARFVQLVRGQRDAHWISNEGPAVFAEQAIGTPVIGPGGVVHAITADVLADAGAWSGSYGSQFLTMLDGRPVAWSDPHGASIEWIG